MKEKKMKWLKLLNENYKNGKIKKKKYKKEIKFVRKFYSNV